MWILFLLAKVAMIATGIIFLIAAFTWLITAVVFYVDDQTHPQSAVTPE